MHTAACIATPMVALHCIAKRGVEISHLSMDADMQFESLALFTMCSALDHVSAEGVLQTSPYIEVNRLGPMPLHVHTFRHQLVCLVHFLICCMHIWLSSMWSSTNETTREQTLCTIWVGCLSQGPNRQNVAFQPSPDERSDWVCRQAA